MVPEFPLYKKAALYFISGSIFQKDVIKQRRIRIELFVKSLNRNK